MIAAPPSPTFRDPAGSLSLEEDHAVRRIHPASKAAVLEFITSDLYARLQSRGDVVSTEVFEDAEALTLIHPRIAIPTYPWEWTPAQWLAAADLTLSLCREAIADGWILKDATPLNILFIGPRPVLVDVLSFERRNPTSAIWLAYGQYFRTFLLPLLMLKLLGWPLALSLFRRDGYEPADLYRAMGWLHRLSPSAFFPITLPAWLEARAGNQSGAPRPPSHTSFDVETSAHLLTRSLASLAARTLRALPKDSASAWADYPSTLTHYTEEQTGSKHAWVGRVLAEFQPLTVLDIGANTGEFSALAAASGATVIALERDAATADRLFRMSRDRSLNIQTIHADLARPTPAVGWDNRESSALIPRLETQCELVLMLAVIHHLILLEQIPIPAILDLAHRLTRRHLLIEWVPVSDPMFQTLMRGRETLYANLTDADLLSAASPRFRLLRQQTLGNGRTLFLFEKL
jgi:hypothetical protein